MSSRSTARFRNRKLLVFLVAVGVIALLAWYANTRLSLEQLIEHELRVREFINSHPWQAFAVGFAIYSVLALIPGTGGKAIVSGWLFGFWQALVIVSIGLTMAAMAIFWLCRYLFRASIERRYSNLLEIMNSHIEKEGVFYLLTLRMAHAPFSIVNPVSSASRISSWTFFWTTVVGLLPANCIWIYVGLRLPSLAELAAQGPDAFIDLPLVITLFACALFPLLVRWLIQRFRPYQAATHDSETGKDTAWGGKP